MLTWAEAHLAWGLRRGRGRRACRARAPPFVPFGLLPEVFRPGQDCRRPARAVLGVSWPSSALEGVGRQASPGNPR